MSALRAITRRSRTAALGLCLIGMAVTLFACDSVPDSPTKPSPALTAQALSSDTQLQQIAYRVHLRLRVTSGLSDFVDAVQTGRGSSEVCRGDGCTSEIVVSGSISGQCDTAVGAATVEIAAAWLDGDLVGIDFCVPTATVSATYQTKITDGSQESNTIETRCELVGSRLSCESD